MKTFLSRRIVSEAAFRTAADDLSKRLKPFCPSRVVYIETGGTRLGRCLADALAVDASGLKIQYPVSKLRSPFARALLFPFKEPLYRLQRPRPAAHGLPRFAPNDRVVLVDDSASTGRTLRLALTLLREHGVPRERVRTVVYRSGHKAKRETDLFCTDSRGLFIRK